MARIYLAASWTRKLEAAVLRASLRDAGFQVDADWIDQPPSAYQLSDDEMAQHARTDMAGVMAADVLVCVTGDTGTRGGRHAEFGMALATGKRVILFGPRECVFHWHPAVRVTGTLAELLTVL